MSAKESKLTTSDGDEKKSSRKRKRASKDSFVTLTKSGAIHLKNVKKPADESKSQRKRSKVEDNDGNASFFSTSTNSSSGGGEKIVEADDPAAKESEAFNFNACIKPSINPFEDKDTIETAVDEIALEGLEGITLEGLWKRLAAVTNVPHPFHEQFMVYIWESIKKQSLIQYYTIDTPRPNLIVPRIDVLRDSSTDIYQFTPIRDIANNVLGSCATYFTRKLLEVDDLTLTNAKEFGNCLILVADQKLRNKALLCPFVDPLLSYCESQYYILEKIGRARYNGEPTTGPNSIASLTKDSKTGFYYRTHLQRAKLITKQSCSIRIDKKVKSNGGLLHLKRFFSDYKSERNMVTEYIVKLLKQKPHFRIEYAELRRLFGTDTWEKYMVAKVIKSTDFRQFVKTDVHLPYRTLYPDAKIAEWKQKQKDVEKNIRVLELKNPLLNEAFTCKEDLQDDVVDSDSESELDVDYKVPYNVSVHHRLFNAIYDSGAVGMSMRQMSDMTMCDHHTTRTVLKNIKSDIEQKLTDSKRKHIIIYKTTASKLKSQVHSSRELADEDMTAVDSFIADTLDVDTQWISKSGDISSVQQPQIISKETTDNVYETLRQHHKSRKRTPLTTPLFFNKHTFRKASVQTVTVNTGLHNSPNKGKLKSILSAIIAQTPGSDTVVNFLHSEKSENKNGRTTNCTNELDEPTNLELKSFAPFKHLLNPRYKVKRMKNFIIDWDELTKQSDSSSDEETLNDFDSGVIAVGSSSSIGYIDPPKIEKVCIETTQVIIDNFEKENVSMCAEFNEPLNIIPPVNPMQCESTPPEESTDPSVENLFNVVMESFMGPAPTVVVNTKDAQGVEMLVVAPTDPDTFNRNGSIVKETMRAQSRKNVICNCVSEDNPIIDIVKLPAILCDIEKAEGYNVNIDRKSLHRLYTSLVREGKLVVIKIILKFQNVVRSKNFISLPNYDLNLLMQNFGDQFKNSFFIYATRKVYESSLSSMDMKNSIKRRFRYSRCIGRVYGFQPKCIKMRILHEFLHYLIRGYSGSPVPLAEAHEIFGLYCDKNSIESVKAEASTTFQRDVNWMMFVPPLPLHKGYSNHWALISDVLLRLPVYLFVKLYNVSYIIPQLPTYLNHPIKKFFIVKNLPAEIKDALLVFRKYIFSIHEIFCYLAYLGLLQFGNQKMYEKDQVFFYLNKHALLYNTSSSGQGYHKITPKDYPAKCYTFSTTEDLDDYWNDMYSAVANTKLGHRPSVVGQSIKLEYVHNKPLLMAALKAQTVESALGNDVGYLPGDKMGVGCTDSALWIHVKRNWLWYNKPIKTPAQRKGITPKSAPKLGEFGNARKSKPKKFKRVQQTVTNLLKLSKHKANIKIRKKPTAIVRNVKPSKRQLKKYNRFDQIDRNIAERMGNSRAAFSITEDKVILVCWACSEYLTYNNKKRVISSTAMRDFIHSMLPASRKTSFAYKRRSVQLRRKNNLEEHSNALTLKLMADRFSEKHFGNMRDYLKRETYQCVPDHELTLAFLYMAYFIYQRWKDTPESILFPSKSLVIQDHLGNASSKYSKVLPEVEDTYYMDPKTDDNIVQDVIQSVIQSSLSCQLTNATWPLQLLRVYQNFSEDMVRQSVLRLRDFQVISGRKVKSTQEGAIRMGGVTYNLSFNYTFKQITNFPHCVFSEAHELLGSMLERFDQMKSEGIAIDQFEQGHGLCVGEYITKCPMDYVYDTPEDVITLNTDMSDFTELSRELTKRYEQLMNKSGDSAETDDTDVVEAFEPTEANLKMFLNSEREESLNSQNAAVADSPPEHKVTDSGTYTKADRRLKAWKLSDMAFMLTKGLFPDLDDDARLEKLNEHFIVRYPSCRAYLDQHTEKDNPIFHECHYDIMPDSQAIINSVLNDALIKNNVNSEVEDNLLDAHKDLLNFIYDKNTLGASGTDLKERYPEFELASLEHLIAQQVVIRVGVCSIKFVHYAFRHNWTIRLPSTLESGDNETEVENYRLRIAPWIRIDGTLHTRLFELWTSIILSHCVSNPLIPFNSLCDRFNIIKPVDIYYLLELLRRLGCVQVWKFASQHCVGLFAELGEIAYETSSMIDRFDEMFVETDTLAITKYGAFLNRNKTKFAYIFDED